MRPEKKSIVHDVEERLAERSSFILTDYAGLNSVQLNELRAILRREDIDYLVVKNRLLNRAMESPVASLFQEELKSPTAIAMGSDTESAFFSRLLVDYAKENEALRIKGGYLDDAFLTSEQIAALAALPSREVLRGMLVRGMSGTLSGFMGGLRELVRQFVSVVDEIRKIR